MATEVPFAKQFQRALSNKSSFAPPTRSSSLTTFKQHRTKESLVYPDYQWILQSDEKTFAQQKKLEERQKVGQNLSLGLLLVFSVFFYRQ